MNKKRQINVNLNTINIPYTMKLNSDRIQKSIISSPPDRIQADLSRMATQNQAMTLDHAPEQGSDSFNDHNLKYGKSQTVKESYFHRLRIHIYRRDKKSKWLDLPTHVGPLLSQAEKDKPQDHDLSAKRETKTAFAPRKLIDPSANFKIKIASSQKGKRCASSERQERIQTILHHEIGLKQMQKQEKDVRWNKFDEILKQKKMIFEVKKKGNKHQLRHLSDNSAQINKRITKLDISKFEQLKVPGTNKGQFPLQKDPYPVQNKSKDFQFEAWDSTDIFSTNRNGIVQYTKEQQSGHNPEIPPSIRIRKENERKKELNIFLINI